MKRGKRRRRRKSSTKLSLNLPELDRAKSAVLNSLPNERYAEVQHRFASLKEGRSPKPFRNWSGKTIREMAVAVQHEEAYDVFYSELSSFAHIDVRVANRFLRLAPGEISWSQRSREFDVGNVFRHASSFLTCYLEFFGRQFGVWDSETVRRCWQVTGL